MMIPSIVVEHISKRYQVGKGFTNLREMLAFRRGQRSHKYHWAAQDVSFELSPGEALGIIGPNGAGKTTILKLLSRITYPTSGKIQVNGRLSALIELGAGFHPDLSGRENVYLNGTILGMRRSEIRSRFDQIVAFAGIEEYLDTPVKRYSSGMYARLGFAVAAHVDPQVLLVDEVLAVGDYAFQTKCHARMEELRKRGTAMIFVSHNLEAVRRVCDRALVMYRGKPIFLGSSADAIVAYSDVIRQAARQAPEAVPGEEGLSQRAMSFDAEINNVKLLDSEGRPVSVLPSGGQAMVAVDVTFKKAVHDPIFSLALRTPDGRVVYDTTTSWLNIKTPDFAPGERCQVEFSLHLPLLAGSYELGVDIAASDLTHYYDCLERAVGFAVVGSDYAKGLVDLQGEVAIKRISPNGDHA